MKKILRVVAPGRPVPRKLAERVMHLFFSHVLAESHDLEFDPQCFLSDGHFAGSDEIREVALRKAFDDDRVDVVWAANGGYGACRLLEKVLPGAMAAQPRIVAGYSDFGFFLAGLYKRSRHHLLHCPMPIDLSRPGGERAIQKAFDTFASGPVRRSDCTKPGFVINLTVLSMLIGTPYEPELSGHVVVLEDTSEYLYAIDRMLFHVSAFAERANLSAVGIGLFAPILPNEIPWGEPLHAMFDRWFTTRGIKVIPDMMFGHTSENKPHWLGGTFS